LQGDYFHHPMEQDLADPGLCAVSADEVAATLVKWQGGNENKE
jgi:hypothetical protein